ncbi:hypothetical protein BGZ96_004247 [Linnemannia gamsii]|uniref:Uncharacterized protein n=1 Tax=Linnemannia gamsii TaxID=64522 RepID=A0ABQ7KGX5_9FUNG|nr:hypothetical protein BGZ96_004247 [Linnemannia gamsii]
MSLVQCTLNDTSHLNAVPTPKPLPRTTNEWFDDPQQVNFQQIKRYTLSANGYGRIRVPVRYYPPVDRGPNTIAVVKDAVATNDFTALSQELLDFFDSAAGYHRAALYGTTDRLKFALVECLVSQNIDPPMFILQALMAVGEISKTRGLDHEFELMVSQFLVDAFCSPSFLLGLTTPPSDEEFCFYGGGSDEWYDNSSNNNTGPSSEPIFMPDVNLQSSAQTEYFSGGLSPHNTNLALSNVITKSASKNRRKKEKAADLIIWNDTNLLDLETCSSLPRENSLLLNFADSPVAQTTPHNKAAVQGKPFNIRDFNDDMVLIDLNDIQSSPTTVTNHQHRDSTLKATGTNTSTHIHIPPPSFFNIVNLNHHFPKQNVITSQGTHTHSIQPHHHQEVLDAILAHKSALQIFLAIDAFELDPILLTHFRSNGIDTKLAAGLVETNKSDLVHGFVGDKKNLCRSVVYSIDRRMAAQIWTWVEEEIIELDQLNHFHALQCGRGNTLAKASKTSPKTSAYSTSEYESIATLNQLAGLVGTAANLGVKFELDNTMETLQSLKLVRDLCTAISLLQEDQQPTPSGTCATSPSECTPSTVFNDPSPTRSSEYQLTRSWKFIPVVLQILKNNVALQRLVIWYGVRILRGLGITTFLASKLGQRAYLDRCLEQVNE